MVPNRHTRHRFSLALVISLLFCGLSSLEFPEFVNLTDDTSNDFTLVVSSGATSSVPAKEDRGPDLAVARETGNSPQYPVEFSIRFAPSHSPTGYLRLLCIHRT
jgi:hypothetical protein